MQYRGDHLEMASADEMPGSGVSEALLSDEVVILFLHATKRTELNWDSQRP